MNLVSLQPGQVLARIDSVVAVYRAAFCTPPYDKREDEVIDFAVSLPAHIDGPSFLFIAACEDKMDQMEGFTYGRKPVPGQFWHDVVRDQLIPIGAEHWLDESYQLAQMAVHPAHQRKGIAVRLHDTLLGLAPARCALLTTMAAATPADELYRSRGWSVLVDRFKVPGLDRPYRIMGREV